MPEQFLLIPGRTSVQGTTLNEGKYTDGYIEETGTLQVAPDDMRRLGLADGDRVRMWNDVGEVVVPVKASKGDELPPGLLFISYGDASSRLMGGETHGCGMPDSKDFDVWIEKVG
jgi:formylmethanofuran dehydrogenase subunit D